MKFMFTVVYAQAYGLSQPQYTIGGTLSGTAGDYWDVLWPHSTNSVSVGFLILSRDPAQLQPSTVSVLHLWGQKFSSLSLGLRYSISTVWGDPAQGASAPIEGHESAAS